MSEQTFELIHNKSESNEKSDLNISDSNNNLDFLKDPKSQFESFTSGSNRFSIDPNVENNQMLHKNRKSILSCNVSKMPSKPLENDMNSERLQKIGEEILERINKKRTNDELMHNDFRSGLAEWTNQMNSKMMDIISEKYDNYSKQIAHKFEMISSDLEKVEKIEQELKKIQAQVELLYQEINS